MRIMHRMYTLLRNKARVCPAHFFALLARSRLHLCSVERLHLGGKDSKTRRNRRAPNPKTRRSARKVVDGENEAKKAENE